MVKYLTKTVLLAIPLLLLVLLAAYFQLQRYMDKPLNINENGLEYVLARGSSLSALAYSLAGQGVLSRPRWLIAYSRLTGAGVDIKAGEYLFAQGTTVRTLLDKIERGDVRNYAVTLVEGWTLEQAYSRLQSQAKLKKTLGKTWQKQLAATLLPADNTYPALEGLFFPDTYYYNREMSDADVLTQAYHRLQAVLMQEWHNKAPSLPYATPYDALIMASLIEKETGVASERGQIAGVFVRRLQQGMRLQTDPAVIYGLGAQFNGNLRTRHLKDKNNPYNTYRHHGLPPTPIALVGREAINAALHPQAGETLYFVAKGDGTHHFSTTLKEHKKAVRKYQILERRKDYSSAPMLKKTRNN